MSVIGIQKVSFKRPKRTDYLRGIDCFNEGRPTEAGASRPFIDGWNKRRAEAIAYNLVHDTMTELEYLRGQQLKAKGYSLPNGSTSSMIRGYLGMDEMEGRKVSVSKAKYPKSDKRTRRTAMDDMLKRFKLADKPMEVLLAVNN